MYDDSPMRKQPISTAVVLEFSDLLKLLNEVQNHIETLACYLNVSILVTVIGSFFIFRCECFIIPTSLSYKRSYQKFICSTVLHTLFVLLFASQLTAALPSMRTSSPTEIRYGIIALPVTLAVSQG